MIEILMEKLGNQLKKKFNNVISRGTREHFSDPKDVFTFQHFLELFKINFKLFQPDYLNSLKVYSLNIEKNKIGVEFEKKVFFPISENVKCCLCHIDFKIDESFIKKEIFWGNDGIHVNFDAQFTIEIDNKSYDFCSEEFSSDSIAIS